MGSTPGLLDGVRLTADMGEQFKLHQVMIALRSRNPLLYDDDEQRFVYLVEAFKIAMRELIDVTPKSTFVRKVRLPRGHILVLGGGEFEPGAVKLFIGPSAWGYPSRPRAHEVDGDGVRKSFNVPTYEERVALQLAEGIVGSCIPRLGRAYQILLAAKKWLEMQQAQSCAVSEGSAVQQPARGPYR